ncbi:MAG: T9SS type A sorting domain-containing protein, partial [Prevotella sp.]
LNKTNSLCAIGGPCTSYELVAHDQSLVAFCGKNRTALEMMRDAMATNYYQENLESVIRTTHIKDNGYYALSGMPSSITYGSTTYDKGWMVWHSLRGYMGDSLFYASVRRLLADKAFGTVDANEVRDSLSSYSGVNLDGFFRFHVFTPGFIDYHVGLRGNQLTISQQGVYTDSLAHDNRVPITFVSTDGQMAKRWYTFSGSDTSLTVEGLPFEPAYCLLDRDCEISDAATRAEVKINNNSVRTVNIVHMRLKHDDNTGAEWDPIQLYIDHHWGHARGIDTIEGVVRSAGRYWTVQGNLDWQSSVEGRFRYTIGSGPSTLEYPSLDAGFYDKQATFDSIALMHRYNSSEPWRCVSRRSTGNKNEGFFTCRLEQGEYTLAVVDTALLSIPHDQLPAANCQLFPNPLRKGEALTISLPDGVYNVEILDATGRRVWHRNSVASGKKLRPNLKKGTYLVVIKNNSVSLQSKLIQL